jgi:hypothetical protein
MENLNHTQNIEYSVLQSEYATFVQSIDVVTDRVRIVTFEGVGAEARFSGAGWTVVAMSPNPSSSGGPEQENGTVQVDDVFETSEALLMRLSPRFTQLWNEKLFEKLSGLQ